MGRLKNGILGSVSGKVGTIVGSSWNGVDYIRSAPGPRKNQKFSLKQEQHQAKFRLATKFMRPFGDLFKYSIQNEVGMVSRNIAVQSMMTQAIGGEDPNLFVDYAQIKLAKGTLKKASNPQVSSSDTGILSFTWIDNTGLGNANTMDRAILIAYDPEEQDVLFTVAGNERIEAGSTLEVPAFSGKLVHTWIAFRSKDGLTVSDSSYTGPVTVL